MNSYKLHEPTEIGITLNRYFGHRFLKFVIEQESFLFDILFPKVSKPTIIHKVFEINSSFHVKQDTMGRVQFLFFRRFLLVLVKILIREGD